MPRVPLAETAARRLALWALRRRWAAGRLDLRLPDGEVARVGGPGPADAVIEVHDERLFTQLLVRGELGAGEGYVAGDWSSPDLVTSVRVFLRGTRAAAAESPLTVLGRIPDLVRHRRAANSAHGSARNIHAHYDLGNGSTGCSSTRRPGVLERAVAGRHDGARRRTARQVRAARRPARPRPRRPPARDRVRLGRDGDPRRPHPGLPGHPRSRCRAPSELARARVAAAGLGDRVDVQLRDYRDVGGTYDKLVSIEMIEAVGHEYLPAYFAACAGALRPGGRMALQAITMPDDRYDAYRRGVDWMQMYIFPGAVIPSMAAIRAAATTAGLREASADDVGAGYPPTLRAWRERFTAALPAVRALGFDDPFVRTWLLYLSFSEAAFAERTLGVHHVVLERP
ncbi:MAG: class I SAM-dependent methyltransferase [Kofleriaceae bacterium]